MIRSAIHDPMTRIYTYQNCDTCRKATRWLTAHAIAHQVIPIRETPPSIAELTTALQANGGDLRKLFNTSGADYRALDPAKRPPALSAAEAFELLASNGNLVKRPFLIRGPLALTGFNEAVWETALLGSSS